MTIPATKPKLVPRLLRSDNFTPPSRTPWGGYRIASRYKPQLGLDPGLRIGEAWELSVEPSFPSRLDDGQLLAEIIAQDPEGWLGPDLARATGDCLPLLVKILDAGADLSVQVHPAADDAGLAEGESGKPEAWIILESDAGAGIYLGWRDGVDRGEVERVLSAGDDLSALLNFVTVRPGEVYLVPPGTPHAIGRGVCLVEPQYVVPGRRAVTYRFWDWNRRYDDAGYPDPDGRPRELHVERAMAVTDWETARGDEFVAQRRGRVGPVGDAGQDGGLLRRRLIDSAWFGAERVSGSGGLRMKPEGFTVVICLGGVLAIRQAGEDGELMLRGGQSAIVPASADAVELDGREVDAILCWPESKFG